MWNVHLIAAKLAHEYFRIMKVLWAAKCDDVYPGFNQGQGRDDFSFQYGILLYKPFGLLSMAYALRTGGSSLFIKQWIHKLLFIEKL